MKALPFAVIKRQGFRDHEATILSAHQTEAAAKRAAAKHRTTHSGKPVDPAMAVHVPAGACKGGTLWDDVNGRTAWSECA